MAGKISRISRPNYHLFRGHRSRGQNGYMFRVEVFARTTTSNQKLRQGAQHCQRERRREKSRPVRAPPRLGTARKAFRNAKRERTRQCLNSSPLSTLQNRTKDSTWCYRTCLRLQLADRLNSRHKGLGHDRVLTSCGLPPASQPVATDRHASWSFRHHGYNME